MINKTYNLTTIKEILESVNENNLKNFIIDFNNYLLFQIHLRQIKILAEAKNIKIKEEPLIFKWTDDGKNDINIQVKIT